MNYANMTEDEYSILVIDRLMEYMKKRGVKQLDLSRESNISQSTLSKILNREAKLTLQHIFKICNALKVDPEILLSFDQEVVASSLQSTDYGLINKKYVDVEILIRKTIHPAFKGYITDEPLYIYLYSTISSESSILEGTIKFEDSRDHAFCKATMSLLTGQTNSIGESVTKDYHGELIISLAMGSCYCILISPEIGEICSLCFKHSFLFNQKLVCRVATVISTSSGTNRLPIMQRALLTDKKLQVNDVSHPDYNFVRGQLKLNDSEIILSDSACTEIKTNLDSISGELKIFLSECMKLDNKFDNSFTFHIFDETKIRSINVASNAKAEGISILRNLSISPPYNKISTKTEEFTFQYINGKNDVKNHDI